MKQGLQDAARAARVALVVGPCLVAINHFDEVIHGPWRRGLVLRILLTLLVPFLVSLHTARAAAGARPWNGRDRGEEAKR